MRISLSLSSLLLLLITTSSAIASPVDEQITAIEETTGLEIN